MTETLLTTTQYRADALPFATELDCTIAVMEYKVANPDDTYDVRQHVDGYYVLVHFPAGGMRWLTRGTTR